MGKKLALVEALAHRPEVLLLDEPSLGLDYNSQLARQGGGPERAAGGRGGGGAGASGPVLLRRGEAPRSLAWPSQRALQRRVRRLAGAGVAVVLASNQVDE